MKTFTGKRNLDEIIAKAKETGWVVDTKEFDKGGDWIWFRDLTERLLQVMYNTFNGQFRVWNPSSDKPIATHLSTEFDDVKWYTELLDLFYI